MFRNSSRIFTSLLQNSKATAVSKRTTYIFRRRTEYIPNSFLEENEKPKLLRKHYYYLLEENTNNRELEQVDIVLLKNVKKIGNVGDIITVDLTVAYEYYITSGAGIVATPENIKKYAIVRKDDIPIETKNLLDSLKRTHVPVFMNDSTKWTLSPWHVKLALRKIGLICNEKNLRLPAKPIIGPDLDLEGKEFVTYVAVDETYTIPLRCRLFHVTFNEINYKFSFNSKFYLEPVNPIFPEEKEILEGIPLPERKIKNEFVIED